MDYRKLNIVELHNKIKSKEISIVELTNQVIANIEQNLSTNFLLTLPKQEILIAAHQMDENINQKIDLLYGIPYLAKDNLSTKNIRTTAASKILDNYVPTFDATVIKALKEQQTIMAGKTALDELGMGGTGLLSAYGPVVNPRDNTRQIGGSSSGSAFGVAMGLVPFALGTDTGDSIRKPASYNGIVGFKPTYGAISRYGLLPYAPSLDHVGIFARNVDDVAIVSDATFGIDERDFTTQSILESNFFANINKSNKLNIYGYIESVHQALSPQLQEEYNKFFQSLISQGYEVKKVDFRQDLLDAISPIYMMLSFSEAVSTNDNLDGINFGLREEGKDYIEIMTKTRTKNFGETVKKRFIIGSLNLKKENQEIYLKKAKQVRRLIVDQINKIYREIDILILPPSDDVAPLIKTNVGFEGEQSFLIDLLILANLSGMPSITIPFLEKEGMPIGINFSAQIKQDLKLLQAAKVAENIIGLKDRIVGDK